VYASLLNGNHTEPVLFDQTSYKDTGKAPADEPVIHRIRITLTSRNVKSLEKG
jgi:hypothetical protein